MYFVLRFLYRNRLAKIWVNDNLRRVLWAGLIVAVCLLLNSACFYHFEGPRFAEEGETLSVSDSLWLSLTTITTVGYGDLSAASTGGRVATVLLLYMVGLACFPYAVGQVLEYLVEGNERRRCGMEDLRGELRDHIVVVNFPNAQKVRRIIEQLRGDALTEKCPIVIVAEELEALPFEEKNVFFVKGSPEESETLLRADIPEARAAIILGPHTDRRTSDAMTAAAVSIIEGLNPNIPTVAECANVERLDLFRFCQCDSIIPMEDIAAKLLVQEVQDPGVAPFLSELLSTETGSEFYSVVTQLSGWTFGEMLVALAQMDLCLIPVGLIRNGKKQVNPPSDTEIEPGDRIVLIGCERVDGAEIEAQLQAHRASPER